MTSPSRMPGAPRPAITWVGLLLVTMTALGSGCAGRRARASTPPPSQPVQSVSSVAVLPLGDELTAQIGPTRIEIAPSGQLFVDGALVGTFYPDGAFYNQSGAEVGRLMPNGRMVLAGTMQDTGIVGTQLVAPSGVIAFIDANGLFNLAGSPAGPVPVIGLTRRTVPTWLFAFSMYAAPLDAARRLGY